jgi:hypothetical protein
MSEFVDLMEPTWVEITFKGWKEKQKELIEFVLQISNLSLSQLAIVIEEDQEILDSVIKGKANLTKQSAINLNQLIYMFASSSDFEQ